MMISNYGTLKTALADFSERNDLTTKLPYFVDSAHQEVCRKLRGTVNIATAGVTINAEYIAQPSGFRAMKRLYLDLTPRRALTAVSAEKRVDLTVQFTATAYPDNYSVEGANLAFSPVPNGSVTAKALYYQDPDAFSVDLDTNVVLTKYPFLYLYGGLAELFRYLEDDNNADRYEARFRAMIDDINASEAKDALSGPLQGFASSSLVV